MGSTHGEETGRSRGVDEQSSWGGGGEETGSPHGEEAGRRWVVLTGRRRGGDEQSS